GVPGGTAARVEPPFQVRLYPRSAAGAAAEPATGTEVDGVHRAGGVRLAGGLAVAVVEAAAAVDVSAACHHVHALRRAAGRYPGQVTVAPVAVALVDVQRIGLTATRGQRLGGGVRRHVLAADRAARSLVPQVVAV